MLLHLNNYYILKYIEAIFFKFVRLIKDTYRLSLWTLTLANPPISPNLIHPRPNFADILDKIRQTFLPLN